MKQSSVMGISTCRTYSLGMNLPAHGHSFFSTDAQRRPRKCIIMRNTKTEAGKKLHVFSDRGLSFSVYPPKQNFNFFVDPASYHAKARTPTADSTTLSTVLKTKIDLFHQCKVSANRQSGQETIIEHFTSVK